MIKMLEPKKDMKSHDDSLGSVVVSSGDLAPKQLRPWIFTERSHLKRHNGNDRETSPAMKVHQKYEDCQTKTIFIYHVCHYEYL